MKLIDGNQLETIRRRPGKRSGEEQNAAGLVKDSQRLVQDLVKGVQMTGLELLKEEMIRRGCTKQQTEAKVIGVVLDILSNTTINQDTEQAERQLARLRREILDEKINLRREKARYENEKQIYERDEKKLLKIKQETEAYIEDFEKAMRECETEKGRDAMRCAQVFADSVNVETKYDNTAYIIGMAAILSAGAIGPITELKKINKKIPMPDPLFGYAESWTEEQGKGHKSLGLI